MFREDLNILVCVMTQIGCVTSEPSLNLSVQFSPLKKKDNNVFFTYLTVLWEFIEIICT